MLPPPAAEAREQQRRVSAAALSRRISRSFIGVFSFLKRMRILLIYP
jgi:hypothetical protein